MCSVYGAVVRKETAIAKSNAIKKHAEGLERNESERTGKLETRAWEEFLAVGEASTAIF